MFSQKVLLLLLLAIAVFGTLASYVLKMHDTTLSKLEKNTKLRMQQVLDECTRRVDQQKAHYEQIYSEKIKEMQQLKAGNEAAVEFSSNEAAFKKLLNENEKLLNNLKAVEADFANYKTEMQKKLKILNSTKTKMIKEMKNETEIKIDS